MCVCNLLSDDPPERDVIGFVSGDRGFEWQVGKHQNQKLDPSLRIFPEMPAHRHCKHNVTFA